MHPSSSDELARSLLDWYDRNGRSLPWRVRGEGRIDPYFVWLSEIMLQQTTVQAVIPYFLNFTERWPDVHALADAPQDDILAAWAGLGYYARARNLHLCAKKIVERGGSFPKDEASLATLPGIGAYTAAAIASIAFGEKAVVVDGNVERVMARLFALEDPLPGAKPALKALAGQLTPDYRPGDYAQAVMDLGATICTPRSPACVICPWRDSCKGLAMGIAEKLPARIVRAVRPTRYGIAFWCQQKNGQILFRKRPEKGLLGGMMEVPSSPWRDDPWEKEEDAFSFAPAKAEWRRLGGLVTHTFSHFHLEMIVYAGMARKPELALGIWRSLDDLGSMALPSVMRKIAHHALTKAYQKDQ